jgi:hypothetical protein
MSKKYVFTHTYETEDEAKAAQTLLMGKFSSLLENLTIIPRPFGFILEIKTNDITDELFKQIKTEIDPRFVQDMNREPEITAPPAAADDSLKRTEKEPDWQPQPEPAGIAGPVKPGRKAPGFKLSRGTLIGASLFSSLVILIVILFITGVIPGLFGKTPGTTSLAGDSSTSTPALTPVNYTSFSSTSTYTLDTAPYCVCFDGTDIWTTNLTAGTVTRLNTNNGYIQGTYSVGHSPKGICFDGNNIWVANYGSGTITRLNAIDGSLLGTYTVGQEPFGICFDGNNIWVSNYGSGTVSRLKAADGSLLGTYRVGSKPSGICFDGNSIWVANYFDNTVTRLKANDGSLLGIYVVSNGPLGICFDGKNLWVANNDKDTVTRLNVSDGSILGTYVSGQHPWGICFDGSNIWVTNNYDNTVTKLKAADGLFMNTYTMGNGPLGICFDSSNIWVANYDDKTITRLTTIPSGSPSSTTPTVSTPLRTFTTTTTTNSAPAIAARWYFNGDLLDSSGNNNNGTANGSITYGSSFNQASDQALVLAGNGYYARAQNTSSLNISGPITVEAWVYVNAFTSNSLYTIVGKWDDQSGDNRGYLLGLWAEDGKLQPRFYISSNGSDNPFVNSSVFLNVKTWYKIIGTFDGRYLKIYVGSPDQTYVLAGSYDLGSTQSIHINNKSLAFGANLAGGPSANYFNGKIDNVTIYNGILPIQASLPTTSTITTTPTSTTTSTITTTTSTTTTRTTTTTPTTAGTLNVTSDPTGASMYIGTQLIGTTGAGSNYVNGLLPGTYTLKLTESGCKDWSKQVTITANQTTNVYVYLESGSGTSTTRNETIPANANFGVLWVYSTPGSANIYVGNEFEGITASNTAYVYGLLPGTYTLKFTKSGYKDWSKQVTITSGQTTNVYDYMESGSGASTTRNEAIPSAATFGTLNVTSDPTGANIYVGIEFDGTTGGGSNYVNGLLPGTYTLKLTESGYKDWSKQVTITANQMTNVYVYLESGSGTSTTRNETIPANANFGVLWVYSTPGSANIYVGNEFEGITASNTAYVYGLLPGTYTLKFTKSGYKDWSKQVTIAGGETTTVYDYMESGSGASTTRNETIPSAATFGTLNVISDPTGPTGANIYVGIEFDGTTGGGSNYVNGLLPGTYTVKVTKPGFKDWTGTVTIQAGQTASVTVTLTP